jgi:hypothetical protein
VANEAAGGRGDLLSRIAAFRVNAAVGFAEPGLGTAPMAS